MTRVRNWPGGAAGDLAVEYQADLGRASDIEVLADDLFEEDASGHRLVEHLGEGELGLQDRELVAIAGSAVAGWKRMRQAPQPLAQKPIDFFRRQAVAQPLRQLRIGAGLDAVVERLEGDPALGQLALEVLVAVDAELGVIGKIGAELQEERSEVLIDAVEII